MPRRGAIGPRPRPRTRTRLAAIRPGLLAILATVGLSIAPTAAHASAQALITDCLTNGKIVGHYPLSDYIQALAHLPTDVDEYSDCSDVIRRAEQTLAAGGKAAAAAAAAAAAPANPRANPLATATPSEQAAVSQAEASGARSAQLGGGAPAAPGVVATRTASASNGIPTPLLVALAIVVLIALALGGWRARKLVRARRAL
jgi:cobalamin biosynthesis Mg chelatase CobN